MSDLAVAQREQIRVLIVEDDDMQAQILTSAMVSADFDVDAVGRGLTAVWQVREGHYDVVLIDYRLPDIDGYAAARLICDFMEAPARPILIALTAAPEQLNGRQTGTTSAFDALVAKSSDLSGLFAVIARCLTSAPQRTSRQAAVLSLLLTSWQDYDRVPERLEVEGEGIGPARILVIDDDECQRLLLTSFLERQRYVVETATDGLDAVRKMRNGCFDLALVDYDMPEMDGLAAGTLIHDLIGEDVRPRLIGLTASAALLSTKEGIARSVFDEIIQKSSDWQALLRSMDRHMRASPNPATRRAAAWLDAGSTAGGISTLH